jgi:4-hydroxy-2-oxoglutarate aldolase
MRLLSGVFTPIVTPFANGDIDEPGLRGNVKRWMQAPLTGLVVLGSSGEAPLLDDDEADRVIAAVRDTVPSDRVLIAGTGRESTKATIAATRRAAALGVDAVLVRTPSFFKPQMTKDAFVRHYTEVADASSVPLLLYNVTMYTGTNLPGDVVEDLSVHPNIVGIKESGSDVAHIAELVARTPDDFVVLAGSATTCFYAMCAGCHGAVLAVASIVPHMCVELWRLVRESRLAEARQIQSRITPLARLVGSTYGVAGLKVALDLLGYAAGAPRAPLQAVPAGIVDLIRRQLESLGIDGPTQSAPIDLVGGA